MATASQVAGAVTGTQSLGTLVVYLTADTTKLVTGMLSAQRTIETSTAAMMARLKALGTTATLALAGIAALSVREAAKFEASFAGVQKTINATEQQFAVLSEQLRALARELPFDVNEINKLAQAAGQLGIQKQHLVEFTKVMLGMAVATDLTSEDAAKSMARLANITGMSQKNFDRLASAIVALGNTFPPTESEILTMALRLGGAGTAIGLTEAQIVALSSALSAVGVQAEAGGTAFSQLMIRMGKAVQQNSDRLALFAQAAGMASNDFARLFKEKPMEALLAFTEGLRRMIVSGQDAFTVMDRMGIDGVRVSEILLRLSQAQGLLRATTETATNAWEKNTALTRETERRYGTLVSQSRVLWNRVKDLAIIFGTELIPTLKELIKLTGELADSTSTAGKTFRQFGAAAAFALNEVLALGKTFFSLGAFMVEAGKSPIKTFKGIMDGSIATNKTFQELDKSQQALFDNYGKFLERLYEIDKAAKQGAGSLKLLQDTAEEPIKAPQEELLGPQLDLQRLEESLASSQQLIQRFKDPGVLLAEELAYQQGLLQAHLDEVKTLAEEELAITGKVSEEKLGLIEDFNARLKQLLMVQTQFVFNQAASMFDSLASIAETFSGRQSALFKTMFAISKAFAIAEAIVKIQQGIANAAALPWPLNLSAMAQVAAATASIVSNIAAVHMSVTGQRASGGPVSPGKAFLVGERGPELFVPAQAGNIVSNDDLMSRDLKVVVNNYTNAQPEVRERNEGGSRVLEVVIKRVKQELTSEILDGRGELNSALVGTFGLRRGVT